MENTRRRFLRQSVVAGSGFLFADTINAGGHVVEKTLKNTAARNVEIIASGLGFPEGPLTLKDGAILFCDLYAGTICKLQAEKISIIAKLGGSPNGLAMGPDNWLYVANNGGGMLWRKEGEFLLCDGFHETDFDTRVERIDLVTGKKERILEQVGERKLQAINDLVFDLNDGFWFTDLGRQGQTRRTFGGVYWASNDGKKSKEVVYPLVLGANGIGLSPDGKILYVTEHGTGRLWAWSIDAPGSLHKESNNDHGGRLIWQAPQAQILDSIAIAASGNIIIATQPSGVFSTLSPEGELIDTVTMPEKSPTNLCFDQNDPYMAYATLSTTGRLCRVRWFEQGLNPYIPIS